MMEKWDAGSEEPIHSHPGDDMTVVVEGKMSIQFFKKDASGKLIKDGARVYLNKGDVGYVSSNRIHDAKYHEACKLVYIHNKAFGFKEEASK
jgi:oxalate decarboxylase/phosphoglucose isomerase-like protein (cupin superfamily)